MLKVIYLKKEKMHKFLDEKSLVHFVRKLGTPAESKDFDIIKANPSWFFHIKPLLASVKPKELTLSSLLNELHTPKEIEVVGQPNITTTTTAVLCIYEVLAKVNRSAMLPSSYARATAHPSFSAAVPWAMAAYKEHHNIAYSRWKLDEPAMVAGFLGKALKDLPAYMETFVELKDSIDLLGIRAEYLEKIKAFQLARANSSKRARAQKDPEFAHNLYIKVEGWSGIWLHMLTQTWVFHPDIRTSDMILSLNSLDEIPEPLVSPSVSVAVPQVVGRNSVLDHLRTLGY